MGTEIDHAKPKAIGNYASSLPPQGRADHRAWIGVRVEALLEPYWDKRPSDPVKFEIMGDWMDALQGYTPDEIREACRAYLRSETRRTKPKPGDILEILAAYRAAKAPRAEPPKSIAAPEHRRAAPESVAEIMASWATDRSAAE